MLEKIRNKIRNLTQDNSKNTYETFTAGSGRTFTISQENASSVTSVTINGTALDSNNYSYDSSSQVVTIGSGSVSSGDSVVIYFNYNKYSDTDLNNYIESALDWMDTFNYIPHFRVYSTKIYPLPKGKEQALIAVIVSILLDDEFSEYRTPDVTIRYPRTETKEQKIEKTIAKFKMSKGGYIDVIKTNEEL